MRRQSAAAVLLTVALFQGSLEGGAKRYLKKETTADLSAAKSVFVGWVDLGADDWAIHGYDTKDEWNTAIIRLNAVLQRMCETKWLAGRTVVAAKDRTDENAAGHDLYVKFSDVRVDYDKYYVYLAIHFIDPKTNTEIGTIPIRPYYGNDWGFEKYIKASLDEVGVKLRVEVTGESAKK